MFEKELNELIDSFLDSSSTNIKNEDKKKTSTGTITTDGGSKEVMVCSVVGVNKEDISLTLTETGGKIYIEVAGSTKDKITGKTYSVGNRILVNNTTYDLSKIEASVNNGLLYIVIPYQKVSPSTNRKIKIA